MHSVRPIRLLKFLDRDDYIFNVLVVVEKEVWIFEDAVAVLFDQDGVPLGEVQIVFLLKTTN